MNDFIVPLATWSASIIAAVGVVVITLFALYALCHAAVSVLKKQDKRSVFQDLRHTLGRGILLGLEFLIASDIIYTVSVELNFQTVGVLAIIILIRTFLSFTLEVEMSGKWPWQG